MSEKEGDGVVEKQSGKSKPRSPNYPAVSLDEAERRVRMLYSANGRAGAEPAEVVKHIGFSGPHGTALVVLSALKKFGLVEDRKGRLVLTQTAIDILTFPAAHPRRIQALQGAALKPAAYSMVVNQYREVGELPSDEELRPELVADRGFTEKSVDGFVADLKTSLVYAGLLEGNSLKLPKSNGDEGASGEEERERGNGDVDADTSKAEKNRSSGGSSRSDSAQKTPLADESWTGPSVRFDLPRGNAIEIRLRSKVTPQEFQKIKRIFDLSEVAFVEDEADESQTPPASGVE